MRRRPYDLRHLMDGGASTRVLNLFALSRRFPDLAQTRYPLFHHPRLNRALLIKHNLRRHERVGFHTQRSIVTKLVLPIDPGDPAAGAFWTFVETPNLEAWLETALGRERGLPSYDFKEDVATLDRLRDAPAFDPFLLSALFGHRRIDPRYFSLSKADDAAFRKFVRKHMSEISRRALGADRVAKRPSRLADILFDKEQVSARDDLRAALVLDPEDFELGVYGWTGVLYYIWRMDALVDALGEFLKDLNRLEMLDHAGRERRLTLLLKRLRKATRERWSDLTLTRRNYERVVSTFLNEGDPTALSKLLMQAPSLFARIGENVGLLTHIASYWRFWANQTEHGTLSYEMGLELLPDLAGDITQDDDTGQRRRAG